jgi:hypothetical protein
MPETEADAPTVQRLERRTAVCSSPYMGTFCGARLAGWNTAAVIADPRPAGWAAPILLSALTARCGSMCCLTGSREQDRDVDRRRVCVLSTGRFPGFHCLLRSLRPARDGRHRQFDSSRLHHPPQACLEISSISDRHLGSRPLGLLIASPYKVRYVLNPLFPALDRREGGTGRLPTSTSSSVIRATSRSIISCCCASSASLSASLRPKRRKRHLQGKSDSHARLNLSAIPVSNYSCFCSRSVTCLLKIALADHGRRGQC